MNKVKQANRQTTMPEQFYPSGSGPAYPGPSGSGLNRLPPKQSGTGAPSPVLLRQPPLRVSKQGPAGARWSILLSYTVFCWPPDRLQKGERTENTLPQASRPRVSTAPVQSD